jgi:hypothetical protein
MTTRGSHAPPPLAARTGDGFVLRGAWRCGSGNSSSPLHSYIDGATRGNLKKHETNTTKSNYFFYFLFSRFGYLSLFFL